MEENYMLLKNTSFKDTQLFKEGEGYFIGGQYEKALKSFTELVDRIPNSKTFAAGRIAITLMSLKRFEEAKDHLKSILKASVMSSAEKERNYNCLYAECLYALGQIKQSEEVCSKIEKLYPGAEELKKLMKKVSIHPHLRYLLDYSDNRHEWNEDKQCLLALESIIEILANSDDLEEAAQYSFSLIKCDANYSVKPYLVLNNSYNEEGKYHYCEFLLERLEKSMVSLDERKVVFKKIIHTYKKSPSFPYSKYASESKLESLIYPMEDVAKEITEKVKNYSVAELTKYIPVFNLNIFFSRELQLVKA
jgi:tetratricopeptide (TPR) repeat protein